MQVPWLGRLCFSPQATQLDVGVQASIGAFFGVLKLIQQVGMGEGASGTYIWVSSLPSQACPVLHCP